MNNGSTDANQRSVGLRSMVVRIDNITGDFVQVVDSFGVPRQLDINFRRGAGVKPRVGERWLIDAYYGAWTLAAQVLPAPHHITGDRVGSGAMASLLASLETDGLVVDDTIDTGGGGGAHPVHVEGDVHSSDVFRSLLPALASSGLIIDSTIDTGLPTVTGDRQGNTALASLLGALVVMDLIIDATIDTGAPVAGGASSDDDQTLFWMTRLG